MDGILQIAVLGGLFFLMMKFGCGSHSSSHGPHDDGAKKNKNLGEAQQLERSMVPVVEHQGQETVPENDVDPVCRQTVPTDHAKTSLYNGLVYFFCSNECREEFESDPEKYAVSGLNSEI